VDESERNVVRTKSERGEVKFDRPAHSRRIDDDLELISPVRVARRRQPQLRERELEGVDAPLVVGARERPKQLAVDVDLVNLWPKLRRRIIVDVEHAK